MTSTEYGTHITLPVGGTPGQGPGGKLGSQYGPMGSILLQNKKVWVLALSQWNSKNLVIGMGVYGISA
jgi:hypothetical protein